MKENLNENRNATRRDLSSYKVKDKSLPLKRVAGYATLLLLTAMLIGLIESNKCDDKK